MESDAQFRATVLGRQAASMTPQRLNAILLWLHRRIKALETIHSVTPPPPPSGGGGSTGPKFTESPW